MREGTVINFEGRVYKVTKYIGPELTIVERDDGLDIQVPTKNLKYWISQNPQQVEK